MYIRIRINRSLVFITRFTVVLGILVSVAAPSTVAAAPRSLSSGSSEEASAATRPNEEEREKDARFIIAVIKDPISFDSIKNVLIQMAKELLTNEAAIAQIAAAYGVDREDVRSAIESIFADGIGDDYSPFCDAAAYIKYFFGVDFAVDGCYKRPTSREEIS